MPIEVPPEPQPTEPIVNMEIDKSGLKPQDDDDVILIDDYPAGLENDDFSDYILNDQSGSKSGRRHDKNVATGFREPKPSQDSRIHSFWGRGYGPHGPPIQQRVSRPPSEHENVGFLIRCGLMKSTLKGLPEVLLNLMQPGYCGVCALGFDHLDIARAHYISKNHGKNQKRWLVLQAKVGSQRPKEIPMRSRELYCELCDIYITSKSHAESHYAGRPHRAIVAGRRVPKNPFLLQENMQERVEQLIRREKKCLKHINKSAASEKGKKDKPIPPELYCEICKTSVTTMEQMTMHLNGRKHLKKEKSHIFKMIEDGTNESKPAEPAGTHKDADAQGAHANEDDFDWGDGSGPWDDDPQ